MLVWLCKRQKRRSQFKTSAQAFDKPELDGGGERGYLTNYSGPHEADGKASMLVEKEAKDRAFEMPAT